MKIASKAVISLVIVAIFMASVIPVSAISIGIAPSEISMKDALRGQEYKRFIAVYNYDNETSVFELGAEGEGKDWVTFCDEENRPLEKVEVPGSSSRKVFVLFDIPENIPNGIYNFTVYAQTIPADVEEEGMVVRPVLKIPADVSIEVTGTQILKGVVKDITIRDIEEGYPLRINIVFQSTGNVAATPAINVEISKDGKLIDSFDSSEAGVDSGMTDTITATWDTTGQEVGAYVAKVTVLLGDETLYMQDLSFEILETGTLSRTGELTDLCCEGESRIGELMKVLATFKNTGAIDTNAKFSGEVYRNGKLMETIDSEELEVPVMETCTLTSYFKCDEPGNYKICGYVIYEGKQTETKEVLLEVPDGAAKSAHIPLTPTAMVGIGVVVALIAIFSVIMLRRRR